jgi:hypothetical protein
MCVWKRSTIRSRIADLPAQFEYVIRWYIVSYGVLECNMYIQRLSLFPPSVIVGLKVAHWKRNSLYFFFPVKSLMFKCIHYLSCRLSYDIQQMLTQIVLRLRLHSAIAPGFVFPFFGKWCGFHLIWRYFPIKKEREKEKSTEKNLQRNKKKRRNK